VENCQVLYHMKAMDGCWLHDNSASLQHDLRHDFSQFHLGFCDLDCLRQAPGIVERIQEYLTHLESAISCTGQNFYEQELSHLDRFTASEVTITKHSIKLSDRLASKTLTLNTGLVSGSEELQ